MEKYLAMNGGAILDTKIDISPLEKILLGDDGLMRVVDYAAIKDFPQEHISLFCHTHAIYQIITTELINFVKEQIGGAKAIEIGSGNGCFGRALGIPLTDNRMQEWGWIKMYYMMGGQPPIQYPKDIIEYDANLAIDVFKPEVVVASWVTQLYNPDRPNPTQQKANAHGINEKAFAGKIKKYIHVGHENVHSDKEILKMFPVTTYKFDWLVSRSMERSKNLIYVFEI